MIDQPTIANANTEVAPTPVVGELSVQFKSLSTEAEKPNITATVDGSWESYSFQTDEPKIYKPVQTLKIAFSKWQVKNFAFCKIL